MADPAVLGRAVFDAVVGHTGDPRLGDDLTILVLRRTEPRPLCGVFGSDGGTCRIRRPGFGV
jgi:hypothetical protein